MWVFWAKMERKYNKLVNVLKMHSLYYTVKIQTRITEASGTAIDNFITNLKHISSEVEFLITLLSDHDVQTFQICN